MKKWIGPLIIGALGCLVLISLGVWQLERLAWKENLIASLQTQILSEPRSFAEVPQGAEHNGTPISATGHFTGDYTDLLSGSETGGAGYRRIAVLEMQEGARLMVELGFLPESDKERVMPFPSGDITVSGHSYAPENSTGSYDEARDIWVGYNLDAMAKHLDATPMILVAQKSPVAGLSDTPMVIDLPNNHLQYAITWFSLALVWALMAIYWGVRRSKEKV